MVKEIFPIRQEVALKRGGYVVIVSWVNRRVSEYKDGGNRRLPGGFTRHAFHRSLDYKDSKQTEIPKKNQITWKVFKRMLLRKVHSFGDGNDRIERHFSRMNFRHRSAFMVSCVILCCLVV